VLYRCSVVGEFCQKHNPDTIEQRYNTKVQQTHTPDTIEQRYNTKVQQKHNPDTTQKYNKVFLCCIVVLL
jgi:hypothetical protein